MPGLFNQIQAASSFAVPGLAFMAGFGGSLHCVGMCGGLVTACAPTAKSNIGYQSGRLVSYSILGLLGGSFGHLINTFTKNKWMGIAPAILIGAMLIFWGLRGLFNLPTELVFPKFLQNLYTKSLQKNFQGDKSIPRAFSIGALSIFLPCGLLYSVVLAVASFQNPLLGLVSLAAFWVGTLPAMAFAPEIIKQVLRPLFKRSPRLSSLVLILIGVATISLRIYYVAGNGHHH